MPIDLRQINVGQPGTEARKAENATDAAGKGTPQSAQTNSQPDSVELSDKAQHVQSLLSDLSSLPEVNESRVEQLRTSIASGEFSVSADKIASKMLDLETGLRALS